MKEDQNGDERKLKSISDLSDRATMFRDSDPLEGMGAIFWPLILAAAVLIGILIYILTSIVYGGG